MARGRPPLQENAVVPPITEVIQVKLVIKLGPPLQGTRKTLSNEAAIFDWQVEHSAILKGYCFRQFEIIKAANLAKMNGFRDWSMDQELYCQEASSNAQKDFKTVTNDILNDILRRSWRNHYAFGENQAAFQFKLFLYCLAIPRGAATGRATQARIQEAAERIQTHLEQNIPAEPIGPYAQTLWQHQLARVMGNVPEIVNIPRNNTFQQVRFLENILLL